MIKILHISDIHVKKQEESILYRSQLATDLSVELRINRLDYVVVSGDIANYATQEEYSAAFDFLEYIMSRFNVNAKRLIIVPGNHDLNWEASQDAYQFILKQKLTKLPSEDGYIPAGEDGVRIPETTLYKLRFSNFNEYFYKRLYGYDYPLDYEKQALIVEDTGDKILFLGLNSSWQIDHHTPFRKRAGINFLAVTQAVDNLPREKYGDWLKIAVWHHPVSGKEGMNPEFMERLAVHGFQLGLHGHVHEAIEGFYKYDDKRQIHVVGAGTFGAPASEQVTGIPLQYNLLEYDSKKKVITVKTRKKEKPEGAWSADARWGDKNNPKAYYKIPVVFP